MSIIIGIDHGYYAIKTAHCSFPAGLTSYGEHEPYTRQGLLEFGGCFFVCGSGRQPIQRDKTINDNYYLLTLAAIANVLTAKISASPSQETACTLSDILMSDVEEKYFLSPKQQEVLLFKPTVATKGSASTPPKD